MRRALTVLALAAVTAAAAFPAPAEAAMIGTLEVNVGYMKSTDDITPGESLGGGLGIGVGFWKSAAPMLSWGGEVSLDNLGSIEDTYIDPIFLVAVTEELSARAFRMTPGVRLNFGTMVGPSFFAQMGGGLYNLSADYRYEDSSGYSFSADDSDAELGFNLGAGVGFPVGPKTRMNFQGQFHSIATDGDNLDYFAVRAGIGFGL